MHVQSVQTYATNMETKVLGPTVQAMT